MDKKETFIAGLIAGALAGAAAALLLTPKEGRETREMIVDRANQVRGRASSQISALRDRLRRSGVDDDLVDVVSDEVE